MHVVGENLREVNLQHGITPSANFDGDTLRLHLGRAVARPKNETAIHFEGTDRTGCFDKEDLTGGSLRLSSGDCVLACTAENVRMPRGYSGRILPTSSVNRDFVTVTLGADLISPGWDGHLTFEMKNCGPFTVEIPLFAHIAQIVVSRCSDVEFSTTSRYANRRAPVHALPIDSNAEPWVKGE